MLSITLNGSLLNDRESFHREIARARSFPAWYGRNLDALHDCLSDLVEDVSISIEGCEDFSPYAHRVINVLRAAAAENPHLQLYVSD